MLLTGSFRRSVDSKQRIAVPKRVRDLLRSSDNSAFFITMGTDRSLAFYTQEAFEKLARRLESSSPTGQDVRDFSRMFYARAHQVELDAQGRFRIPEDLVRWAQLGDEVVLNGVGDHLEIWDTQHWEAYLNERQPRYDEIAERAFTGSIPQAETPRQAPHHTP
ncbi:MAG: division/cell wall cluster transcriptional repressor MraZ [Planctomycetales bacterium]|nr:division/cell wall cluster transcriptional repressor MraZ [Planctomycetales bacterium]